MRRELERHPSHSWAERGCEARLIIELVVIGKELGGGRYLTGWLDGEVPHRVEVGDRGLGPALEELLTVVLHNDPRRLRGPEAERDLLAAGVRALRLGGQTYFGVEIYALGAWVDGRPRRSRGARDRALHRTSRSRRANLRVRRGAGRSPRSRATPTEA